MERLIRAAWRLYPRSFRDRFGADLERDLREHLRRRGRVGTRLLADACWTCARAWASAAVSTLSPESVATDLALAIRSLRRSPGYASTVVAILALALGANTAVFSVAHSVLLRALPYGEPERVYGIQPAPLVPREGSWAVDPDFASLPHVEAAALYLDDGGANLAHGRTTVRVSLAQVTADFFRVLALTPLLGRDLSLERRPDVAVLSHALWVRAFGADRTVLGRRIELNGAGFEIVGVMPADAAFPAGAEVWLPFPADYRFYGGAFGPSGVARLREGASAAELAAVVEQRIAAQYADAGRDAGAPPPVRLTSLRDALVGSARAPLYVLLATAGLVALLGCLNLAGLVLARTNQRAAELSIRRALGASRSRLFGQLVAEVLVLAGLAGAVGIGAAALTSGLLAGTLPAGTPGATEAPLGPPALGFAALLSAGAAVLIGVLPSLHGAATGERPFADRTATEDRGRRRSQALLVGGQVAVAAVLVLGASLLGRSLQRLEAVPLGYDLEHVLTFQVRLPEATYPDPAARRAFLQNVEEGLRGVPGVRAVGATTFLPRQEAMGIGFRLVPDGMAAEDVPHATWVQVTRGYFEALGLPVRAGSPFADPGAGPWDHVVVSEALERALNGRIAVGAPARVDMGRESRPTEVAAVVADLYLRSRQADPARILYTPLEASTPGYLSFAVRADGDPSRLVDRAIEVVRAVDPSVPPFALTTTGEAAAREIAGERAVAVVSRLFSASALALTALGLWGLVANAIARRRRELGIRLVMGARPAGLVRTAMRRPLALTGAGLAVGVLAGLAAARLLEPLLFGVPPADPTSVLLALAVVLVIAALASYLPARRALELDPAESLRSE